MTRLVLDDLVTRKAHKLADIVKAGKSIRFSHDRSYREQTQTLDPADLLNSGSQDSILCK